MSPLTRFPRAHYPFLKHSTSLARKAGTLFSLIHSWLLVCRDGLDPRSLIHTERLKYLELRPALSGKAEIVVYDIGANVGEFACFLAKSPSVAVVYCFEPLPEVFSELQAQTRNIPKIRCFQIALGDRCGLQPMLANQFSPSSSILPMTCIHTEEIPGSSRVHPIEVHMLTLEEAVQEYSLRPPDFIKMDVQGFEDRVIGGGLDIVRYARFCLLELSLVPLYQHSVMITEMNGRMRDLGFRLVKFVGEIKGKTGEILQLDGLYRNDHVFPANFQSQSSASEFNIR